MWKKVFAGSLCGCLASGICNPTDLVKIRMQTQGPYLYSSIYDAIKKIYHVDGFRGFYVGVVPSSVRATVLAATELSMYDETKELLIQYGNFKNNDFTLHFLASLLSGFVSTITTTPFDFAKSRIMNSFPATAASIPRISVEYGISEVPYNGMFDCIFKSAKSEGILVLWSGFWATFARLGPNISITFIIMEQLRIMYDD
jgi:hypothetical protein